MSHILSAQIPAWAPYNRTRTSKSYLKGFTDDTYMMESKTHWLGHIWHLWQKRQNDKWSKMVRFSIFIVKGNRLHLTEVPTCCLTLLFLRLSLSVSESQRTTCRGHFSPCATWWQIKHRPLGLADSPFTHQSFLPDSPHTPYFWSIMLWNQICSFEVFFSKKWTNKQKSCILLLNFPHGKSKRSYGTNMHGWLPTLWNMMTRVINDIASL